MLKLWDYEGKSPERDRGLSSEGEQSFLANQGEVSIREVFLELQPNQLKTNQGG